MSKNNKTCGECKYRYSYHHDEDCDGRCKLFILYRIPSTKAACSKFEPIPPPTNGDRIQQGGNRALAEFAYKSLRICRMCAFSQLEEGRYECAAERGQSCIDGIEAWLNAPAESEGGR